MSFDKALGLIACTYWGIRGEGMLALEYALTKPAGLASLILADTCASIPLWEAETHRRLVTDLPPEVQQVIQQHEANGTTDSLEYIEACKAFSRRHLSRRIDPLPECLQRITDKPGEEVYYTMWGPSEWCVTGSLKDWDITSQLDEIHLPTLVLGGSYDEATPAVTEALHREYSRLRMGHLREQRTFSTPGGNGTLPGDFRSLPGAG